MLRRLTDRRHSISQRRKASLRPLLVKCGLSPGGCEASRKQRSFPAKMRPEAPSECGNILRYHLVPLRYSSVPQTRARPEVALARASTALPSVRPVKLRRWRSALGHSKLEGSDSCCVVCKPPTGDAPSGPSGETHAAWGTQAGVRLGFIQSWHHDRQPAGLSHG